MTPTIKHFTGNLKREVHWNFLSFMHCYCFDWILILRLNVVRFNVNRARRCHMDTYTMPFAIKLIDGETNRHLQMNWEYNLTLWMERMVKFGVRVTSNNDIIANRDDWHYSLLIGPKLIYLKAIIGQRLCTREVGV